MAKRHVLVTGGAGFIGSHLVRHHLELGDSVWVVDNLQTGKLSNLEPFVKNGSVRFDQADLRSWCKLDEAVVWADRIYHMAAHVGQHLVLADPVETLNNNIYSFDAVLRAMSSQQSQARILLASTSELYCHSDEDINGMTSEEAVIKMYSGGFLQENYSMGKFINELALLSYAHQKGIHGVIARIFNTIGLNQNARYGFVVPRFIEQALSGKPMTVYGDGLQTRSFINVRDTASAMALLLDCSEAKGEIVNVGNDRESTVLNLAELVKQRAGSSSPIQFISYQEAYGVPFVDVRRRRPDISKLKRLVGFHPSIGLESSIEEIINQYRSAK